MESTLRAMSSAERLVVPLKSMCSMKWETPFCSPASRREPEPTQMPTLTLRTWGMTSVITRTPLSSAVTSILRNGKSDDGMGQAERRACFLCSISPAYGPRQAAQAVAP